MKNLRTFLIGARKHSGRTLLLPLLVAFALFATACGSDAADSSSSVVASGDTSTSDDDDASSSVDAGDAATSDTADTEADQPSENEAPQLVLTDGKPQATLPAGPVDDLIIEDLIVGDGAEAKPGNMVEVHYVGVLACTGVEFDASWNRNSTFSFVLGASQVIYGWDAGVAGMRVGGQRQLTIPSHQAYGDSGSGSGSIGPGADLVFVVDLISIEESDADITPREAPEATPALPAVPDKPVPTLPDGPVAELVSEDIVVGTGDTATTGSVVEVNYVGVLACNGQEFDASWNRGDTFTFVLGAGGVIPGWDIGVEGMQVGGQRQLTIPFNLAYGSTGSGPIPAGADLVFVVDLVGVGSGQPEWNFPDTAPDQLEIEELTAGTGPEIGVDELALVHFAAATFSDKAQVESTWASGGQPVTMSTGADALAGLAQGLLGAQQGTVRQIIIPPALAFGDLGQPNGSIGPNETLIVLIEVVELRGPIDG